MNNIAIENLKLINKLSNDDYLISEGKKLLIINKNDFESVIKFDSLEYPIYFTFNYLLNDITENAILTYKYKIQLLELINESINNLINYLDIYDEKNTINLINIINDFDERYDIIREKTISRCNNLLLFFDDLIESFIEVSRYIHIKPYQSINENDESKNIIINKLEMNPFSFEGVIYHQDKNSKNVYNIYGEIIGLWENEKIHWNDKSFSLLHESQRDKPTTFTEYKNYLKRNGISGETFWGRHNYKYSDSDSDNDKKK